jgi:hypothetical protein
MTFPAINAKEAEGKKSACSNYHCEGITLLVTLFNLPASNRDVSLEKTLNFFLSHGLELCLKRQSSTKEKEFFLFLFSVSEF